MEVSTLEVSTSECTASEILGRCGWEQETCQLWRKDGKVATALNALVAEYEIAAKYIALRDAQFQALHGLTPFRDSL